MLVVSCGGTISSVQSAAGTKPRLGASDLVSGLPQLTDLAATESVTFSVKPSSDMTLDDVLRLHRVLEARLAQRPDVTGIVITQGTDTLEEVAFGLDLLWNSQVPLVITGAMRNASLPSSDGPANILAAVATAISDGARDAGVLVVLNNEIQAAVFAQKTHTQNVAAFRSPSAGPLGYVAEGEPRILARPLRAAPLRPIPQGVGDVAVALITSGLGDDGRMLTHLIDAGYGGLVIEALGGGHLPAAIARSPALAALADRIPIVLASRVAAGELLRSTYTFPGSETDLLASGLISSGVLNGPKARILLTLLLASGAVTPDVATAFARHGRYASEA